MQFRPDLRTGTEQQQPHRLAAVAQGQHKQPRPPVFPAIGIAHQGARSVIDLAFFAGCSFDHRAGFRRRLATEIADEALDTLIAAARRYSAAVSRRMPVAFWIFRSDHPSRPNAITCCFFSSFKTLLTLTEGSRPHVKINVLNAGLSLAGFEVTLYGRFWVTPEGITIVPNSSFASESTGYTTDDLIRSRWP